ncbi:reverse transcriptase domain-containing protein [Tanacetum coccineum]
MVPATTSLVGFSGEIKWLLGQITLFLKIGDDEHSTSAWMDFMVLVRQKKRGQAAERNIAINDEVSKLVAAGIMREVHYHDWLSNPVMECQVHKPVPRNPQEKLNPITSPWPFYKWGIDIAGPFPEGPGKVKFLIVAMDYFTKWIEAKPVATITGNQHFASAKHPQTNGLVERANQSLGEGIKARLGKDNKNWMEEISHVLWAHQTMVKFSNGDTPFSLTYKTEVVIPAEIEMPTFRTAEVDMAKNDEALKIKLELLEENFKPGDLVYRNNEASRAEDTGKLGPKWEGLYEVTEALGKGSYRLKDHHEKELPQTWNVCNLKKCYIHKM